jgi:signal transduction histidine kinase
VTFELFDLVSDLPEPVQQVEAYSSGAIQAEDGTLWFATRNGAVRIDPARISRNPLPPPVSIRSAVADGKRYSVSADPTLPALTKSLKIEYAALSLSIPERVKFRYKLEGWNKEWHDAGTAREAFFTNLAPRKYSFHVTACNNSGVWNETGATFNFTVLPAWYQTDSFLAFGFLVALLIFSTLYRLRLRQVAKAISARFDERLVERTRIAREIHDTFLQTIQGSKLVVDDALDAPTDSVRMQRAMEQLSVWLGQATEEGRAALRSLRSSATETNDLADAFRRALEECRIQSSIEPSLSIVGRPREMHPIVRDEVYRIGYEAIHNACAHSQGTQLRVELIYATDLSLRIGDNGRGMDRAVADRGKEGHFGLQGMRERAARILSTLRIASFLDSGTEIELIVPGKVIYRRATLDSQGPPAVIKPLLKRFGWLAKLTKSD